jgi:hypothetical protein
MCLMCIIRESGLGLTIVKGLEWAVELCIRPFLSGSAEKKHFEMPWVIYLYVLL